MRRLSSVLAVVLVALVFAGLPARAQVATAVQSMGITVTDMDRAIAFYNDVLGFEPVSDVEVTGDGIERLMGVSGARIRIVGMTLGQERIDLISFLAPTGRPFPADMRSNDEWFQHIAIVVSDMDAAYAHLRDHGVDHASTGPQTLPDWNPAAGGISAFYFRDPDGNHLEVIHFPPDKGNPRWQEPTDALFLGIDHTAIVVDDTEASLAFWQDALGLEVAGGAENYGTEQEHLNNVFGARLRITGLAAEAGIGVEFLEYLAPSTGRPAPVDTNTNDLWHWHISLVVEDADAAFEALRDGGARFVSPGPIDPAGDELGFDRGLMLRDPDGHGVMLIER